MLGAGALLASYSRDNEREADALGMEYMVQTGYGPDGFVGLMDMLKSMSKHKPNTMELMFATHPMSDERYQTAVQMTQIDYRSYKNRPVYRDRYMDNTARLRKIKGAIDEMQNGEKEMVRKKFVTAEAHFRKALEITPNDYAGLTMMSKCLLAQKKMKGAQQYADRAKQVYPNEAQAYHLAGFARIQQRKFDAAYEDFKSYVRLLPGNPNTNFLRLYVGRDAQLPCGRRGVSPISPSCPTRPARQACLSTAGSMGIHKKAIRIWSAMRLLSEGSWSNFSAP